jgi:hypothetical protein
MISQAREASRQVTVERMFSGLGGRTAQAYRISNDRTALVVSERDGGITEFEHKGRPLLGTNPQWPAALPGMPADHALFDSEIIRNGVMFTSPVYGGLQVVRRYVMSDHFIRPNETLVQISDTLTNHAKKEQPFYVEIACSFPVPAEVRFSDARQPQVYNERGPFKLPLEIFRQPSENSFQFKLSEDGPTFTAGSIFANNRPLAYQTIRIKFPRIKTALCFEIKNDRGTFPRGHQFELIGGQDNAVLKFMSRLQRLARQEETEALSINCVLVN